MDVEDILVLGVMAGAGYLFLKGRTSAASSNLSPTGSTVSNASELSAAAAQSAFQKNTSDALATIWENAQHGNSRQSFYDFLQSGISARMLPAPTQQNASTNCQSASGAPGTTATVSRDVAAGAGIVTSGAVAAGAAAGSVVPIIGTAIGAFAGLISSLFGAAHAKAVQEQAQAICQGWTVANQLYQEIDSLLASGRITPSQASSAYAQIQSQFTSIMKTNTSYKTGDALWGFDLCNQAIVAARQADLRAGVLTGGQPAPWGTSY